MLFVPSNSCMEQPSKFAWELHSQVYIKKTIKTLLSIPILAILNYKIKRFQINYKGIYVS